MTQHITDATLGRRFWAVNDFSKLTGPNALNPANPADAKKIEKNNTLSPTIVSFVNAGGDTMAQSAINKAQLFATTHTLTEDETLLKTTKSAANRLVLLGGEAEVTTIVDEVAAVFVQRNAGVTLEDAKALCRTALNKLMATAEFDARANRPLPANATLDALRLGVEGLKSLKNAMLGLSKMLHDGTIREDAVIILADGKYYDAANRSDLLRLTADSAQKVKDLFIGKERYDALVKQCKDRLIALGNNISPQQKQLIENQINALEHSKNEAIRMRTEATACIKTDYQIQDSSGKEKNERKFQKKQLDQIRDSLRAFRYDIDCASGKGMGIMEWVRRKFDNLRSSIKQNRITDTQYNNIVENDNTFNNSLVAIRGVLNEAEHVVNPANHEPHPELDEFEKVSANVGRTDTISSADFATAATKFSHITNDRIRYHYSGTEKREAENFKAISKQLGNIAKNGGERTVTLKMGIKAMFDLNLLAVDLKAKAGGVGEVKAKIKVDNADGSVNVTYSIGGKGEFSASTKVGVDPKNNESEGGFGAKVEGKASAGLTHSVTKTYANLEEFAKTVSRLNILMTPRPRELFYSWGKAALKGIGHCFVLGATVAGFRIHRSNMDQHAYSATLRNRNIFGEMGGIFLKKRNVEIIGERKALTLGGALQGKAKGGIYFETGGSLASNIDGELSGGIDYSREVSASGKLYKSFAKSLRECSEVFLRDKFTADAANLNDDWKDSLVTLVNDTAEGNAGIITNALSALVEKLTQLEDSVLNTPKKDKAFWQSFAQKAKLLAVTTALLSKRAEALNDAVDGAANAKTAAKAAVGYIIPRLANPVVKIPTDVYRTQFFDIFEMAEPRTTKTVINVKFSYNALGNLIEEKMNDLGIGKDAKKTVKGNLQNTAASIGVDLAKPNIGLAGTIELRFTRENVVSNHQDARPWLRNGKMTFDLRLPANAPIRLIVDIAARHYVKSRGGLSELDESKWKKEFMDGFIDGLKNSGENFAIENAPGLLDMSLGEIAEKYPAVSKFIGGVSFLKEKRDADYAFEDASYKTLSFELDNNWRFTSFKLAEDYDSEGKLEFTPSNFISIELSLGSKTSVDDWKVFPTPKPTTLMKRAADYCAAGNTKGFINFLARSKKGVLRLMDAAKDNEPNRPDDKYWQKDKTSINNVINECNDHLNNLTAGTTALAEQARRLRQTFTDLVANVKNPPADLNDAARLELAAQFFTVASQIYTLAEMTRPRT